jgi:choline dehydrogenase
VVVACGGVHSPTLLLRSGIGPADELRRLGINVVCDLPGVGSNLQNHPVVPLAMYVRPAGVQSVASVRGNRISCATRPEKLVVPHTTC